MKKRIIPSILLRRGTSVVLSQQFTPWRTVGAFAQQLRLHVRRHCDELLVINMDLAGSSRFQTPHRLLSLIRQEVDIPIAYAGGISTPDDAASCINAGFDKVYITASFLDDCPSVSSVASVIGAQSTGICLPYRRVTPDSSPIIWDYRRASLMDGIALNDAVKSAIDAGAGEVLLYDVDRDGSLQGLDKPLLAELEESDISIPVLLAGGAGTPEHFREVLCHSAIQGVVAGSIFSLTQETPSTIRCYCENYGIPMRRL